jgi:hypothetical protein
VGSRSKGNQRFMFDLSRKQTAEVNLPQALGVQ